MCGGWECCLQPRVDDRAGGSGGGGSDVGETG